MIVRDHRRRHAWHSGATTSATWATKHRPQREFLATGGNGSWFLGGYARNCKILGLTY